MVRLEGRTGELQARPPGLLWSQNKAPTSAGHDHEVPLKSLGFLATG